MVHNAKKILNTRDRRKEILSRIEEAGHPKLIHQGELGKEFGVTQSMISRDIDAIKEEVIKNLGANAEFTAEMVFLDSVKKLKKEGKHKDAAQVQAMYYAWLYDSGIRTKASEKIEVTGSDGGPLLIDVVKTVKDALKEAK